MKGCTILLVEDSADDEALTVRALKQYPVANQVVVVRDGAEALDFLHGDRARPLPELVLLDLNLPGIDGLEVLRRIRADERTARLPVVILTGSAEESDLARSYAGGASSYVRKPVDFDEFLDAVRQLAIVADRAFSPATIGILAALSADGPEPPERAE
jgi:two-component system response regulator